MARKSGMLSSNGSAAVREIKNSGDAVEEKLRLTIQREEHGQQRKDDVNSDQVLKSDPEIGGRQGSGEISKGKDNNSEICLEKNPYTRLVAVKRRPAFSKTSNTVIAKHLPGSRLNRLKKSLLKNLEEFPLFQELHFGSVTFTAETLEDLKRHVHDHAERLLSKYDATGWQVLQKCIYIQEPIAGKTKTNSNYRNTRIFTEDMRQWIEFPTFDSIEEFSKSVPQLKLMFHEVLIENASRGKWFEEMFKDPGYFPSNEESSLSRNFQPFFAELSALIRLACVGFANVEVIGYEGVAPDSKWVTIGGGKCAMKRRSAGTPEDKIPDLVAYWTNGDYKHLEPKRGQKGFPANGTQCHIVGDFKMATKFDHSMLLPERRGTDETRRVMNQIHDYMDMSNNKYGYVVTQTELIMFRRRDVPAGKWGQIDFSPSIPVSTKKGKINAMMVLWYFHVKYAVMGLDGGWELESCYLNCPEVLLGDSVSVDLEEDA